MTIKKLLIANRGEIALRVIRAAKKLGIKTVQVYSNVDKDSLPVKMADESVEIGPHTASKSYLHKEKIIETALAYGVDAIHPGYGFLSENAEFADMVEQHGITFVGPSNRVIRLMGDKLSAIEVASAAHVPTLPSVELVTRDTDYLIAQAEKIGYPLMVKASAGGGGRGIRVVHNQQDLISVVPLAAAEAQKAFGNDTLYLEKLITNARHIEVQVLGDGENVVHLFERDCSLQRKRQKVWEEAPAFDIDDGVRHALYSSALRLAKEVNYASAGTIEYLCDPQSKDFYFLEMNTRIQVEHPITEMITGIDIVEQMLRIAGGERLSFQQDAIQMSGHSIEVRITAEDANNQFLPSPGTITHFIEPDASEYRFDHMLYQGYTVSPFYDSLLGKLIVWGKTRDEAIIKMRDALEQVEIAGIKTTVDLFQDLVNNKDIQSGLFHTTWMNDYLGLE